MKKRIQILMSTYNGEKYIKKQLESIIFQKNIDFDLLIRDDGSQDKTTEICEIYNGFITICKGYNMGPAKSFYKLVELSGDFDFYAFSDQDDIWDEDKLEIATKILKDCNPEKPCMYCSNYRLIDCNDEVLKVGIDKSELLNSRYTALAQNIATGCTIVFNKKAKELFLSYKPKKIIMHDYWMYLICVFMGEVYYDPTPHIGYRQHDTNVLGDKNSFSSKWKNRINSLKHLSDHQRDVMSEEFLNAFEKLILQKDKIKIKKVACYRKNIIGRLKLFLDKDIYMLSFDRNFWFKIRILFGII